MYSHNYSTRSASTADKMPVDEGNTKDAATANMTNNELAKMLLAAIKKSEENLNNKLTGIETKVTAIGTQVTELEGKHNLLSINHYALVEQVNTMQSTVDELNTLKIQHGEAIKTAENKTVMTEFHSKKYNLIVFNLAETCAWETPKQSRVVLNNFLKNILKVNSPENIAIANCHRLHSKSSKKKDEGTKNIRPLIFKVCVMDDLTMILEKSQEILKNYNIAHDTKFGVFQQLPKRMQDDKNSLLPKYRDARKKKQKTNWRIDRKNWIMYLQIDNNNIMPDHS